MTIEDNRQVVPCSTAKFFQQYVKCISLSVFLQSKVALLPSESYTVGDLKGEILSLKGLLLNRYLIAFYYCLFLSIT